MTRERVRLDSRSLLRAKKEKPGGDYFPASNDDDVEFFPSGSKLLDLALGGGWAERRIINILGNTSTGKTLVAIEAGVNFLRKYEKGKVRYRETENAFQKSYAETIGMPIEKIDFGKEPCRTIEDLYEELEYRVEQAKQPELMIVDSLDAMSTRAELKRAIDEASFATEKAKMMSALFRRINSGMAEKHITMMVISQLRDKIGNVTYGKKTTSSGGRALPYYTSQRVELTYLGKLDKTSHHIKRVIGIETRAVVEKNKVGPSYREAFFPILFGYGIDDEESCRKFLTAVKHKAGSKYTLKELHRNVEHYWKEIEEAVSPKRSKYT